MSLGTLFLAHTDTCTHIHSVCSEIRDHSHMSHIHIQGHACAVCLQKHTSRLIREETGSEKYTNPCKIHHLLSHHTRSYQTDTTETHTI